VIRYLTLKNLGVAEIATELQSVYGTDALKYSTVSKWRLCFQNGSDDLFDLPRSGRVSRSDLAAPIQSLLQQFPFISNQVRCRKLKTSKELAWACFTMMCIWKSSITLCCTFTGNRSKAVAGRSLPRASPDTRTTLRIRV
jgi:hypothetical protein